MKILDFGLAKLTQVEPSAGALSVLPTTPPDTLPGVVLGIAGYMAPEQVRGLSADHRADIFAYGVVLYEMLSGERAFRGETAMDTMTAILKEQPPQLPLTDRHIPATLTRVIDRCLEKHPAERFQSARDLAFAVAAFSIASSDAGPVDSVHGPRHILRSGRVAWSVAAVTTTFAAAIALPAYLRPVRPSCPPAFRVSNPASRERNPDWSQSDCALTGWAATRPCVCRDALDSATRRHRGAPP